MIELEQYLDKKVGVVGLGKAGRAAVASLLAGGAHVYAWDDGEAARQACAEEFGKLIYLHSPELWPWGELDAVILSPGVPLTHPAPHPAVMMAQKTGVRIIGEVEALWEAQGQAIFLGITGTNGKSTTTALIGHILKACGIEAEVGGNLGIPALALKPLGAGGVYVLEMSSYQLDLIDRTRFRIGVLLNITPDHLDRHGGMEGYIAAKAKLFANQQPGDVAIIAVDDAETRALAAGNLTRGTVVRIGARGGEGGTIRVTESGMLVHSVLKAVAGVPQTPAEWLAAPAEPRSGMGSMHALDMTEIASLPLSDLGALPGGHNWQNAACAYAACRACGLSPEAIFLAMESFPGLAHRMEKVGEAEGIRFINDSKATNADATANALAAYGDIYWILGGKPKAGGIAGLEAYFPRIRHAYLIGEAAEEFAGVLEGKVSVTRSGTLAQAVQDAAVDAKREGIPGAVVLLSPACASFDQFKSFEERGDVFRGLVKDLEGGGQ